MQRAQKAEAAGMPVVNRRAEALEISVGLAYLAPSPIGCLDSAYWSDGSAAALKSRSLDL